MSDPFCLCDNADQEHPPLKPNKGALEDEVARQYSANGQTEGLPTFSNFAVIRSSVSDGNEEA